MSNQTYYKVAKTNGFDFHTGKTINYRKNIGKIVINPKISEEIDLCSDNVLHASKEFLQALNYGEIGCSIFRVEGNPVSEQTDKLGFKQLKIVEEINTKDWNSAYYRTMIYILEDVKNNYDNEKNIDMTKAIDQTIQVFINANRTGKVDESAAESARSAARSEKLHEYSEKFIEELQK